MSDPQNGGGPVTFVRRDVSVNSVKLSELLEQEAHQRYLEQELRRYEPGEKLTLYPRDPGAPHGLPDYEKPPEHDLPDGWIPYFDPTTEVSVQEEAQIEVLEVIAGGTKRGAQLLLCKVLKAPAPPPPDLPCYHMSFDVGMKLVLKVFDSIFFPEVWDWHWTQLAVPKDVRVDGRLSRQANVYQHLFSKGITGHPHIVPQYHGSWAMKFAVGDSSETQWRCAGAVLIEYIEGTSMEALCDRDEYERMVPETGFLSLPSSADGSLGVPFNDLTNRLRVFKAFLDGLVSFLHTGSHLQTYNPPDVFLTLGNNGVDLNEPRVVILDYSHCVVWSQTIQSKIGRADEVDTKFPAVPSRLLLDKHPNERLPNPPHPAWMFNHMTFSDFAGWFPSEWMKDEAGFEQWVEAEFGEPVERKYSTLETLNNAMDLAIADAVRLYASERGIHPDDAYTIRDSFDDHQLGACFGEPDPMLLRDPDALRIHVEHLQELQETTLTQMRREKSVLEKLAREEAPQDAKPVQAP
ncbi:hypothetical protein CH063_03998 [Colletotrichum higginsianum]|uniref:Uncharacterized protein n=2 Tax=Colletotrichum higginsianum TaxID=80884 RepID=H1W374_COLHI|nr:uncharacterized protein CH63R_09862 [Colletotrichum higginsianum IMI 349063]OBR05742.1 hypothetical protein CH63R_09862 [Colletotrichum higginsianum IMI 349063]TIC90688.1 hypothetical protein CH35J_011787 [Colletotrichum higginsianum]GJD03978.1 hypothetical protein ColKHC_12803 [Colletotrichum higginsianum]CCF46937.1 hypothetical protein CH063_03998 [Colletotrichum higginsianum]